VHGKRAPGWRLTYTGRAPGDLRVVSALFLAIPGLLAFISLFVFVFFLVLVFVSVSVFAFVLYGDDFVLLVNTQIKHHTHTHNRLHPRAARHAG
jgi:hypothetical protein